MKLEILEPAQFFLFKCPDNPTISFGWFNETSAGNFEWWNMWSVTFRWPWFRHYRGFVKTDETE